MCSCMEATQSYISKMENSQWELSSNQNNSVCPISVVLLPLSAWYSTDTNTTLTMQLSFTIGCHLYNLSALLSLFTLRMNGHMRTLWEELPPSYKGLHCICGLLSYSCMKGHNGLFHKCKPPKLKQSTNVQKVSTFDLRDAAQIFTQILNYVDAGLASCHPLRFHSHNDRNVIKTFLCDFQSWELVCSPSWKVCFTVSWFSIYYHTCQPVHILRSMYAFWHRSTLVRFVNLNHAKTWWRLVSLTSCAVLKSNSKRQQQYASEHPSCRKAKEVFLWVEWSGLFSFLSLYILDSFPRLLSSRLSPSHQRCERRRRGRECNRHLGKWDIRHVKTTTIKYEVWHSCIICPLFC